MKYNSVNNAHIRTSEIRGAFIPRLEPGLEKGPMPHKLSVILAPVKFDSQLRGTSPPFSSLGKHKLLPG